MRKDYLGRVTRKVGSAAKEFNYANNGSGGKIHCSFPIIGASEKIAQLLSTQSKLSKEL